MFPYSLTILIGLGLLPATQQQAHCLTPDGGGTRHDAEWTAALIEQQWHIDLPVRQLLLPMAAVESGFRASVVSEKGAVGVLQITPIAEKHILMNLWDRGYPLHRRVDKGRLADPRYNVNIGARYMQYCWDLAGGDKSGALACYNGGPRQLQNLRKRLPLASETREYIRKVLLLDRRCATMPVSVSDGPSNN